jgi:hypothetical protein
MINSAGTSFFYLCHKSAWRTFARPDLPDTAIHHLPLWLPAKPFYCQNTRQVWTEFYHPKFCTVQRANTKPRHLDWKHAVCIPRYVYAPCKPSPKGASELSHFASPPATNGWLGRRVDRAPEPTGDCNSTHRTRPHLQSMLAAGTFRRAKLSEPPSIIIEPNLDLIQRSSTSLEPFTHWRHLSLAQ